MIANYKNYSIEIVEEGIFINSYFYLSFAKKEVKDKAYLDFEAYRDKHVTGLRSCNLIHGPLLSID